MRKKLSKNIEWSILICTVLLVVIGLFAIYSATLSSGQEEFRKQTIWLIVSIPITIAVFFIDYSFMSKISVNDIVNHKAKNIGIVTIKKLCDGLDMSISDFFDTDVFRSLEQELY